MLSLNLQVSDENVFMLLDEIAEDVFAVRKNEIDDFKVNIRNEIKTLKKREQGIID
jgi:hypothetical protein